MSIAFIESEGQWTALVNGESFTFNEDHVNYEDLVECVNDDDVDGFLDLIDVEAAVVEAVGEVDVVIRGNSVFYQGVELHGSVVNKILEFQRRGLNFKPLTNFLQRLMQNPSKRSVDQLFSFLQHKNIAIAPDGRFLAYKTVRDDYKDKYSGKFDNRVGAVMEMPRNTVDDNSGNHCSHGFHVGSLEYAGPGGFYNSEKDKVMIVAVDPADAVSVPNDHNCQKLRVCKYEVVGHYNQPLDTVEDYSNEIKEVSSFIYDFDDLEVGQRVKVTDYHESFTGEVTAIDSQWGEFDIKGTLEGDSVTDWFSFDFDDCEIELC
jgi:hypothetical protein